MIRGSIVTKAWKFNFNNGFEPLFKRAQQDN